MGPCQFVGRAEELELVREIVAGRAPYAGVVIVGASGSGKTRLAQEAVKAAPRRSVLTVAGVPAAEGLPLVPLLAAFPDLSVEPARGIAQVRAKLAGQRTRPILLVDDAQWLDSSTQTLVHLLVVAGEARVVVAVREDAPIPVTILNLCKEGHLRRIDLAPLSPQESAELVADMLGAPAEAVLLAELFQRSQGLPLALRELIAEALTAGCVEVRDGLATVVRELPRSRQLNEVIVSNLERFDPDWLAVLGIVAVAEPLPLALLVRLVDEANLIAAEKNGLIRIATSMLPGTVGPVVSVDHPLYGEAALTGLTPGKRHQLLAQLVDAAQSLASAHEGMKLRLAAWCLEIGRPVATEDLMAALRLGHRALNIDQAATVAEQLWRERGDFETGILYATALQRALRHDLADDILREVKQLALTHPQRVARVSLVSEVLARLNRYDEAIEELRLVELDTSDSRVRAQLATRRGFTAGLAGRTREGLDVISPLLRQVGSVEYRQAAQFAPSMLGLDGRAQEALEVIEQLRRLEQIDRRTASDYLPAPPQALELKRGLVLLYGGWLAEAAACAAAGLRTAEEIGQDYLLATWLNILGRVELDRGHPVTAILHLGRVLAETPRASGGSQQTQALNALVEAHALLGQVQAAERALNVLSQNPADQYGLPAGLAEMSRGYLAAAMGRHSDAQALFSDAFRRAAPANAWVAVAAAHAITRYGQRQLGLERARELPDVQGPLAPLRLAHQSALVERDAAALVVIAAECEQIGADLLAAEACAAAADMATQRNDSRLEAMARRIGEGPLARTEGASTPDLLTLDLPQVPGLTQREREIATLAARGLTSPVIAASLVLSARTVDNTLQRIYDKLGVRKRQDLAAAMAPYDRRDRSL
jgi:DNA-binding NarL/FixJ family response regulator